MNKQKTGHRPVRNCCALALGMLLAMSAPALQAADSLGDAFREGDWGFSLRWRFESVNQDGFDKDARAIPLRTRFNYGTASLHGWSLFAEVDYVFNFGVDSYDEGAGNTPDRGAYPVIADVSGADLNQAFLQYRSDAGNRGRLGRQRLIYDNARYIGNVGWRQNEQTYDGLAFERKKLGNWDLHAAWLGQVNRIFGNDVPAGEWDMNTWLLNASVAPEALGKFTFYGYYLDIEDAAAQSNQTLGVRFTGNPLGEGLKFGYGAEFSYQEDAGNNPVAYDANYIRLDASLSWDNPTVYVGFESLGGSDVTSGQAFRTPLATLHAFNGFADKFLTTPDPGLDDLFGGVKGNLGQWKWNLVYHDFSAESGSEKYGREIDAVINRKFGKRFGVLFKYADFQTKGSRYPDTRKFWAQLTADF